MYYHMDKTGKFFFYLLTLFSKKYIPFRILKRELRNHETFRIYFIILERTEYAIIWITF